jgi:hypothetical protein
MKLIPINSSHKDPENGVFVNEVGNIFRKINSKVISHIEKSTRFVKTIKQIDGDLFQIEKFKFEAFFYEYPFQMLKDSALYYLDTLTELVENDLIYSDGNPLNSTYVGNNKFLQFDLGSIVEFKENNGWTGYKQFLTDWLWPLYYLSDKKYIPIGELWNTLNDHQFIYHYNLNWKHKFRPSYWVHNAFLQTQKRKKLVANGPTKENKISKSRILALIALLKSDVNSAKLKSNKTKWDNYYSNTIIQNSYLENKSITLKSILNEISSEDINLDFILDWGANDGYFSKELSAIFPNATIIAIESDHNAVNDLYIKCKNDSIIPIHGSILNPTPALTFSNYRKSLSDRLKPITNLHACLGLMHHLQHEQNLSYQNILNYFVENSKSNSYLLIEFVKNTDPRYQLIRNPNYPHSENIEDFKWHFENYYQLIKELEINENRVLFLGKKKS